MEEKNDISILNLIEKNIGKIKASHNVETKSFYISTIENYVKHTINRLVLN